MQAFALPIPGQKFVDPLGGMVLQAGEDVGEPGVSGADLPDWFLKRVGFALCSDGARGAVRIPCPVS